MKTWFGVENDSVSSSAGGLGAAVTVGVAAGETTWTVDSGAAPQAKRKAADEWIKERMTKHTGPERAVFLGGRSWSPTA